MQRFIYLFCFGLTLLTAIPKPIYAGAVNQTIPGLNLTAEADYTQGDSTLPAVLILHGFLTTHHFHTVQTIKQAFEQAGYSTLAPTLTLNVDRRREFLQCNALHTHTLENDLLEIDFWIQWLKQQGHEKVVLVGHSSGSQTLLHFLAQKNHPDIALGLFTSLFFMNGPEMGTREAELQSAQKALQTGDNSASKYHFLFCQNNYFATPESFLSYQKLDRTTVLSHLTNLDLPHYTLMGEEDKRYQNVGSEWLVQLKATGTQLQVIPKANHFFASDSAQALQEAVIRIADSHFKRP